MKNILMFDYDGVIVDSLHDFRENLIMAAQSRGFYQISEKTFLSLFNGNLYEGIIELGIPKGEIPQILSDLKLRLLGTNHKLSLFDGVKDALEELCQTNEIIIITSNVKEVVENFFNTQNIKCYGTILGAEEETSKVAKILKVKEKFPNSHYFYIGDTRGDIVEGKKAGVKTIAVTWGWHNKSVLEKENLDYLVDFPRELVEMFKI